MNAMNIYRLVIGRCEWVRHRLQKLIMKASATRYLAPGWMVLVMLCSSCAMATPPSSNEVQSGINGAQPGTVVDKSRPFSEYQWLTSHNAFVTRTWTGIPNQDLSIAQQLARGVRGLMLDTYNDPVKLCHPSSDCRSDLSEVLSTITSFLDANPEAVITVFFEDYATREAMQKAFNRVPAMKKYVFNPKARWSGRSEWPSLQEMISSNQRLILITQEEKNAGVYADNVYMFKDDSVSVENTWSLGKTIFNHDLSCKSRYDYQPLSKTKSQADDIRGWSLLFVMNHYHDSTVSTHSADDNEMGGRVGLADRVNKQCKPAAGRDPNYIALDFVEQGDALEYVEAQNNGRLIAYEGNNQSESIVCTFSTAFDRTINLQSSDEARLGCENDEMRSISLSGVKKGTRLTFYDSPSGDLQDDYTIIDIKRDIGRTKVININSFEQLFEENDDYRIVWVKNNGLDGWVSRIKVENKVSPSNPDAALVLYEASNGGQNNLCTIKLDRSYHFNFPGDQKCDNDDAISGRLLKAKKGTVIQLYGNWHAVKCDQGCSTISVLQDVDTPITIPNFEYSWTSPDRKVQVVRSGGSQQLNGKISSARVTLNAFAGQNLVPDIPTAAADGYWGTWGSTGTCPAGKSVWGFKLKSEPSRGTGDDTALNAVEMYCSRDSSTPIRSKEGPWGSEVKGPVYCGVSDGPVIGFQIRIEAPLSGGNADDTAAGNVRLICKNGKVLKLEPSAQWGTWSPIYYCPPGQAANGFKTRVEDPLNGDDTALNGMRLQCGEDKTQ